MKENRKLRKEETEVRDRDKEEVRKEGNSFWLLLVHSLKLHVSEVFFMYYILL